MCCCNLCHCYVYVCRKRHRKRNIGDHMAKRIKIYKGKDTQEIWEDDFPNMEGKGWSKEPPKPKAKKVITEEVEDNGNI